MASESFGNAIERFLCGLRLHVPLPEGITVLDPYRDAEVRGVVHTMTSTYYTGTQPRLGVWGINPGRFGAGVTGLSFTDPWALEHQLGIATSLRGRRELSAEFISMVIDAYGGPHAYYHDVYMCALSPLGFVKDGVNINFYDDKDLQRDIVPFVLDSLRAQHAAGLVPDRCIVLGSGALRRFMERSIRPVMHYAEVGYLDHPRYIMQYKRSQTSSYVREYVDTIHRFVHGT